MGRGKRADNQMLWHPNQASCATITIVGDVEYRCQNDPQPILEEAFSPYCKVHNGSRSKERIRVSFSEHGLKIRAIREEEREQIHIAYRSSKASSMTLGQLGQGVGLRLARGMKWLCDDDL